MSSASIDRPVAPLLSSLIDAAHQAHQTSSATQQPQTTHYTLFKWQLQEAAEASKSAGAGASSRRASSSSASGSLHRDPANAPRSKRESMASFCTEDGGLPTPNLEVTCEYDANFQSADLDGSQGGDVRPGPQPSLGPIAFLFRWYTKRATQFPPGYPSAADLQDAPAMLPPDPFKVAPPPSNTMLASPSKAPPSATPAGPWNEGLPLKGGHSLNRAPDPVMSAPELCAMLEELGVVPQCVSRQDVTDTFTAAMQVKCDPPNRLPCGQVRPDEIRFPHFCDALVRLAIAADARTAVNNGTKPGSPEAAVTAMLHLMEVTSSNLSALKRKLDALARMAAERGAQRNSIKWMYVGSQSAMEAARKILPPLEGGWSVDSASRAPQELHDALMAYDRAACTRYIPDWRTFPEPALNLGTVVPGEVRCLRMLLRNRNPNTMYLRIDTSAADGWLTCAFKELPLPSGVPRVLDIVARFEEPGEYIGSVQIFSRIKQEGKQCINAVPFYALVTGADSAARAPMSSSERGVFAARGAGLDPPSARAIAAGLSASASRCESYAASIQPSFNIPSSAHNKRTSESRPVSGVPVFGSDS